MDWFRRNYNGEWNHEKFWTMFDWLQKQKGGIKILFKKENLPLIQFYIDTVKNKPEYVRVQVTGKHLKIG